MQRLRNLTLGALLLGGCAPALPPAPTVAPLDAPMPDHPAMASPAMVYDSNGAIVVPPS